MQCFLSFQIKFEVVLSMIAKIPDLCEVKQTSLEDKRVYVASELCSFLQYFYFNWSY